MKSVILLSLAACAVAAPTAGVETIHDGAAPILSSSNAEAIPNAYIIKFKKHVDHKSAADHQMWIQKVHGEREDERLELRKRGLFDSVNDAFTGLKHTYNVGSGFLGYAGHFDEETIEKVRRHPDVEAIERDTIVHTMRYEEVKKDECNPDLEKGAPWGLSRVSHRESLSFSTYNKYLYSAEGGEGVDAYVIDTGTNIDHVDFEGRAHWGKTIPANDQDIDGNGHGTHCSGTVAGKKYGVAKKAQVYAVKVLKSNGSGTMSDVIAGVDFAAKSHKAQVSAAKDGKRKGFKGSVANMSLGGGKTTLLDAAVNAAVDAGIHFAVAAGNDNADACNYSPAAAAKAVTVGASALDDSRAYFSNWGKCTDIFAPGLNIQSTWIGSKTAINTISGTSMASPHIAGLLAYYLSLQPASDSEYSLATITPEKLKADLIKVGTVGILTDIPKDTPNVLAWNGGGCSNYFEIVSKGGYKAKAQADKSSSLLDSVTELEKAIEHDFRVISGKVVKEASSMTGQAEKLSEKIHQAVDEELKHFFGEARV
ncbi:subtilisin-like proteinase Spm1 [Pyricularia oryzae 70-15]|uniref:Subtilisin-like proteinase Spm1 n=3 Tax=Pyricularia oryzae TaxID=318829 RepID=SPM1_PYRO7|nr:subtilisin-like proteinase Spm1 [Pyricularia oryzae 70-15]P58371.1 RecName: Full=Subtilisin-like proteinase Spm1; AltName: Full=Serine protease of Magnaporthe 1; Flags: Precursor [Pyricularia oryzae 70-15]ELQ38311.1 cerevisin [Pyricularia oryzae Y34]KAI7919131.1 subtilisin-like proteinase Spm1 [Pyricularia oryzae]BAB63284.1 putative vacuolar subtilisin-like serine protease [Pyricularia grisea]EHA49897.1 subtilisin-like proteinase Spm1 [Pyricularia oryzae 70-15]KAI7927272.1 subtilisin-like 